MLPCLGHYSYFFYVYVVPNYKDIIMGDGLNSNEKHLNITKRLKKRKRKM